MFINHSSKEVTAKVVFYGPGLSGKTTCLQYIFSVTNPNSRGELISIETEIERTLFFDLLPINVGLVKGYQTKFQLYTVPGQVFYDSTRKLVLKGADGVVFVADSQLMMEQQNFDSLENLKKNMVAHKLEAKTMPIVFQYNKRDLNNILSIEKMNKVLNPENHPYYGSIATKGEGVIEALREISSLILKKIRGLLDNTEETDPRLPQVEFDTDKKHKIIDKEHLPLKKIHADSLQKFDQKLLPKELMMTRPPREKEKPEEEFLMVETVEEIDDLGDILIDEEPILLDSLDEPEVIRIDEETKDISSDGNLDAFEIPELEEFDIKDSPSTNKKDIEVDIDTSEFREIEEFLSTEKEKETSADLPLKPGSAGSKEKGDLEEDLLPFKDLDEIQDELQIEIEDDLGATKIEFAMDLDDEIQELEDIGELVDDVDTKRPGFVQEKASEKEETREAYLFSLDDKKLQDSGSIPQKPLAEVKNPEPPKDLRKPSSVPPSPIPPKGTPSAPAQATRPTPPAQTRAPHPPSPTAAPAKPVSPPQAPPPPTAPSPRTPSSPPVTPKAPSTTPAPPPPTAKAQTAPPHPAPPKPVRETKEPVDTKKAPGVVKPAVKEVSSKPKSMDIFDQFKDKSRVTVIKAISIRDYGPDTPLIIDIKDKDSNLLESVNVHITPEIKKITLILDVKK